MNKKSPKERLMWPLIFIRSYFRAFYYLLKFFIIKKKDEIFIILTGSIGDDVYGMSYIHELKKRDNKKIIIYCLQSKRKLVENYNVADEIRSYETGKDGWRSLNYYRRIIDIARNIGIYSILPDYYIPMEKNGKRSCLDIMKYDMLRLGDNVTIQYPDFSEEPIISIPNISEIASKTVLLNYSSKSMSQVDLSFFQTIADDLLSRGYNVFTNVVGNQRELIGTKPLNCPIYELFAICNRIKAVISVRSGILDICAHTSAPFLVYNFPFKGRSKQYNEGWCYRYKIKAWGKENVSEYFVDENVNPTQVYNTFRAQFID